MKKKKEESVSYTEYFVEAIQKLIEVDGKNRGYCFYCLPNDAIEDVSTILREKYDVKDVVIGPNVGESKADDNKIYFLCKICLVEEAISDDFDISVLSEIPDNATKIEKQIEAVRTIQNSFVYSSIGNKPDELDFALIIKEGNKGVVIGKLEKEVIAVDISILSNTIPEATPVLNYQVTKTEDDAYDKMLIWIGKMIKRNPDSRYFNHSELYDVNDGNRESINKLIRKVRYVIDSATDLKKIQYYPMNEDNE